MRTLGITALIFAAICAALGCVAAWSYFWVWLADGHWWSLLASIGPIALTGAFYVARTFDHTS